MNSHARMLLWSPYWNYNLEPWTCLCILYGDQDFNLAFIHNTHGCLHPFNEDRFSPFLLNKKRLSKYSLSIINLSTKFYWNPSPTVIPFSPSILPSADMQQNGKLLNLIVSLLSELQAFPLFMVSFTPPHKSF